MYRIEEFPGFPNSLLSVETNPWGEGVSKWGGEESKASQLHSRESGLRVILRNKDSDNSDSSNSSNNGNRNSDNKTG